MREPLISVIIPSCNSGDTVAAAITSITQQTYQNLEILVVDDNSTDHTADVVQKLSQTDPRIKYLRLDKDDPERFDKKINRNINAGYAARNFGFQHVRGEYITFQDADDVSLLNRIEIQYQLLQKYRATHLSINWVPFEDRFVGKKLDLETYLRLAHPRVYGPKELHSMAANGIGMLMRCFPKAHRRIHFYYKRLRGVHRLFFGNYLSYPGSGNCAMFKREVIEKIQFRKLAERVWPTFMGRGADRDFNFNVAYTFGNSYVILVPLYLWHNRSDKKTEDISAYIKE